MKSYKGYLIDLDGTMYRGTEVIKEAGEFVKKLIAKQIPYLYVTNNSTKTPEQVAQKLRDFGVPANPNEVFTSAIASANYIIEENKHAKVFMIGEKGLYQALTEKQISFSEHPEKAEYVVVGMDTHINFEKLTIACLAVRNGATFIITNGDTALPSERGLLPGNGALSSVITVSTNKKPIVIGKPESIIVNQVIKLLGLPKEEVAMVGDNYHTDIMAGINADIDTILVHTGVTTPEHLKEYAVQPTFTVNSLSDWEIIK